MEKTTKASILHSEDATVQINSLFFVFLNSWPYFWKIVSAQWLMPALVELCVNGRDIKFAAGAIHTGSRDHSGSVAG